MATYTAIIEDTSNSVYAVRAADGIDHAWIGIPVKAAPVVGWAPKGRSPKERLVRKVGCKVYSHTTNT